MEYKRSDRVADLLRREIAELLLRRVKDPRVAGVIVTGVELTPDLRYAKVFFCITGGCSDEVKENATVGLSKAKGFMRQELGKRLYLRHLPQLDFQYDASFEYGEKIERLLKELHRDE
jgi:ribosome-binding factor A